MTDNYYRLNYSDNRDLSDFQLNADSLTYVEMAQLISDKKNEVITNATNNELDYKIWYNSYNFIPTWVSSQLYDEIVAMPRNAVLKAFLDHPVFGSLMMTKLLVGIFEAYRLTDYEDEFTGPNPGDVVIAPKALSRTEATKSIGDMSISFESERLGIKIDTPFEQLLSTLPNGIEIIEFYKNTLYAQPKHGVV